jgi:hypothetical protein
MSGRHDLDAWAYALDVPDDEQAVRALRLFVRDGLRAYVALGRLSSRSLADADQSVGRALHVARAHTVEAIETARDVQAAFARHERGVR